MYLKYTTSIYDNYSPSYHQEYKTDSYSFDTALSNISPQHISNRTSQSYDTSNLTNHYNLSFGPNSYRTETVPDGNIEAMFLKIDSTLVSIHNEGEPSYDSYRQGATSSYAITDSRAGYLPQHNIPKYEPYQGYQRPETAVKTQSFESERRVVSQYNPNHYSTQYSFQSPLPQVNPNPSLSYQPQLSNPTATFSSTSPSFFPYQRKKVTDTDYTKDFTSQDILSKLRLPNKNKIMEIKESFQNLRREKMEESRTRGRAFEKEQGVSGGEIKTQFGYGSGVNAGSTEYSNVPLSSFYS